MENIPCSCENNTVKTVFACSGAADLGEISDKVARELHLNGTRQMKCLAFISAGIQEMINSIKDTNMLVIDGCPLDCGKLTMERNEIKDFCHLRLTDLGYIKGKTHVSDEVVTKISEYAISLC